MSAVVGVYLNFKVSGGGNNIFGGMMTQYIGCASDELSNVSGNTFLTNTYLATDATASQFWVPATKIFIISTLALPELRPPKPLANL